MSTEPKSGRRVFWENTGMTFPSISAAARYIGIPIATVCYLCNGGYKCYYRQPRYAGLRLKWATEVNNVSNNT